MVERVDTLLTLLFFFSLRNRSHLPQYTDRWLVTSSFHFLGLCVHYFNAQLLQRKGKSSFDSNPTDSFIHFIYFRRRDHQMTVCTWKRAARTPKKPNGGTMVRKRWLKFLFKSASKYFCIFSDEEVWKRRKQFFFTRVCDSVTTLSQCKNVRQIF